VREEIDMSTRARYLAAAVAAMTAVPSVADARTQREVRIKQTVAVLSTGAGVVTSAGANAGSPGGRGAVTGRTTITDGVYRTEFTNFYEEGTIRAVSRLTRREQPDGSATFSGTGSFKGGTGSYARARGRFRVKATVPPGSIIGTFRLAGRISY
jgi:hypothetical protein